MRQRLQRAGADDLAQLVAEVVAVNEECRREVRLAEQPAVAREDEAAVVAVPDSDGGVRILAFLGCRGERPSIIALKRHCSEALPAYMVPDQFLVREGLPKTSTDKIDYQRLLAEVR